MKKKILTLLLVIGMTITTLTAVAPVPNAAAFDVDCSKSFLGLRPWHYGLAEKDGATNRCVIPTPEADKLPTFVGRIALNILSSLFTAAGYAAIIFAIYGGFLYIMSRGDPGKTAKGKKTLITAAIGIGIILLASVIVNTIIAVLDGATS